MCIRDSYIYIRPNDADDCINELNILELQVEKLRREDNGKLKNFLKVTLNHPQDIYKLRDKILDLKSVKEIREHDIPFYRRYLIDKGLFPMNIVEVHGKILNSNRFSPAEKCIFEVHTGPKNLGSGLEELNMLSFNIEACNPDGMPKVKEDPCLLYTSRCV